MKRPIKAVLIIFMPYFALVFYLVVRGPQFTKALPHWVWIAALCYFLLGIIGTGLTFTIRRGRPTAMGHMRSKSTRALKTLLVLYLLIFLNGVVLIIRGSVPLKFAIPGLTVDALLIALFLWILARQKGGASTQDRGAGGPGF
jgi:hypothetical protein